MGPEDSSLPGKTSAEERSLGKENENATGHEEVEEVEEDKQSSKSTCSAQDGSES